MNSDEINDYLKDPSKQVLDTELSVSLINVVESNKYEPKEHM